MGDHVKLVSTVFRSKNPFSPARKQNKYALTDQHFLYEPEVFNKSQSINKLVKQIDRIRADLQHDFILKKNLEEGYDRDAYIYQIKYSKSF
jgi:hypothetical protein